MDKKQLIAQKPAYRNGQLLLADDFIAEQRYHIHAGRRHSLNLHGWGVVRASNTEPAITTRFEAQTPARVAEIRSLMLGALEQFKREHNRS